MEIKVFSPTSHKIKALIYGDSWTGKTSFWATAPNVIFASAEAGLLSVWNKRIPYVEIKSLKDLHDLYFYLAKGEHPYETVVIDSISEINDLIKTQLEIKRGRALQIQDWGEIAKNIEDILRKFRSLDMHVIMIAQETIERDDQKIVKYMPSLNGKTATKIAYFMDIVWHIEVLPTGEHLINTQPSPKYLTKDRTGKLWNGIAPDFNLWTLAVESMEISEDEESLYNEDETNETAAAEKPAEKKEVDPTPAKKEVPKKETPKIWDKETPAPAPTAMAKPKMASEKQIAMINDLYGKYKEKRGEKALELNDIIARKYSLNGAALRDVNELTTTFASDLIKTLQEQVSK